MKVKLVLLYLLKFTILLLSIVTLGCHVAQLILLNQTSGTGSWWPDYVPYTLYYVGTIFSTLSSTLSLFLNCIITLSKSLRCDCFISSINLLLFIAIITYNSLKSDMIPWTGLIEIPFSANMKGYATYCTEYSNDNIAIRCWLSNGTWLGMVIVGFFWLLFLVYSILLIRQRDTAKDAYYDFKNDVPMANPRIPSSIQRLTPLPVTTNEVLSSRSNQYQHDVTNYNSNALGNNIIYEYNSYTSPLTEQRYNSEESQHESEEANMITAIPYQARRMSKTYLEDENEEHQQQSDIASRATTSSPVQQPPHSYDLPEQNRSYS